MSGLRVELFFVVRRPHRRALGMAGRLRQDVVAERDLLVVAPLDGPLVPLLGDHLPIGGGVPVEDLAGGIRVELRLFLGRRLQRRFDGWTLERTLLMLLSGRFARLATAGLGRRSLRLVGGRGDLVQVGKELLDRVGVHILELVGEQVGLRVRPVGFKRRWERTVVGLPGWVLARRQQGFERPRGLALGQGREQRVGRPHWSRLAR